MGKNKEFDNLEEFEDLEFDYDLDESDTNIDESLDNSLEDSASNNNETYEEYEEKPKINILPFLSLISTWFIRLGILLAIGLLIMFFVTGKIGTAFLYIFGLLVSFSFGYVFMFCLDHFIDKKIKF